MQKNKLFLKKLLILFNFLRQRLLPEARIGKEIIGPDFAIGSRPVTHDLTVLEDDGPEDAVATVGAVHVVRMHRHVTTFVPDQVFIV